MRLALGESWMPAPRLRESGAALEDRDLVSRPRQGEGRRQAGDACPDDGRRAPPHAFTPAASRSFQMQSDGFASPEDSAGLNLYSVPQ